MDSVLKQMLLPNYNCQVMTPFIKIKKKSILCVVGRQRPRPGWGQRRQIVGVVA